MKICCLEMLGFRWGGEEFIMFLPFLSLDETMYKANELRKAIEAENFNIPQSVTCSFGVNKYAKDDTKEKLLEEIAKALYSESSHLKAILTSD